MVANCPLKLHRQIFFTNCILTGGSAPCCLPRVLHPGGHPPHGAHQLFLTNRTLTGSPGFRPPTRNRAPPPSEPGRRTDHRLSRIHRKLTIIWCDAPLVTLHQVFLTDNTLTGSRILGLLNGSMVGLMADMFLSSQCVLTVRRFRTTSAHCDDRRHCAQQRASRTCPTAASVWRLGCSCIFFTASN